MAPTALKALVIAGYLAVAAGYLPYFARQLVTHDDTFGSDLTVFYMGSRIVRGPDRGRLYDEGVQRAAQAQVVAGGKQFPGGLLAFLNPPHVALLLAPMSLLGRTAALWLWTAGSLVCLALLARGLLTALGPRPPPVERWLLLAALFAFRPVYETLQLGQLSLALGLALWGLWVAVRDPPGGARDARAALCVLVLGIKPQLLPMAWAILLVFGRIRALALSAAALAVLAGLAAAVLGRGIWLAYARNLAPLETNFGYVTADYMLALRGPLAGLLGPEHPAALATALVVQAAVLLAYVVRGRARGWAAEAPARTFALGAALGLLFDVHIFMLDALLWVVPLALTRIHLRAAGRPTAGFDAFALAWPGIFLLHEIIQRPPRHLPGGPAMVPMAALTALLVWWLRTPRPRTG